MSTATAEQVEPGYLRLPLTPDGRIIQRKKYILKSPRTQVVMSFPKTGKTDSLIDQPRIFIGDAEGGTEKFEGNNCSNLNTFYGEQPYVKVNGILIPAGLFEVCKELNRANRMKEFHAIYDRFREARSEDVYKELVSYINSIPYPIFVLDTLTNFMPLVYGAALAEYNEDHQEQRTDIRRIDKFGGTRFIRKKVEDIRTFIEKFAAPFIIYTGHIKERKAVLEKADDKIAGVDLALEGQLPLIFTSKAEAVGLFLRNKDGCFLDYQKKSEDDVDARSRHLGGRKIKISELHTYETDDQGEQFLKEKGKTYWERIYPEINFQ